MNVTIVLSNPNCFEDAHLDISTLIRIGKQSDIFLHIITELERKLDKKIKSVGEQKN